MVEQRHSASLPKAETVSLEAPFALKPDLKTNYCLAPASVPVLRSPFAAFRARLEPPNLCFARVVHISVRLDKRLLQPVV